MTLRAGSYDASRPDWRGLIRQDSYPWYVCTHYGVHETRGDAQKCSQAALPALKARDHQDPEAPLPEGWRIYTRRDQ